MTSRYYDHRLRRAVDLARDGCGLEDWPSRHREVSFARHLLGFPVFIPPADLEALDEYKHGDPFTLEENRPGEFECRRSDVTAELVRKAAETCGQNPRILDVGCGRGRITARIHEELPGAEVSAIDCSLSAIEYAAGRFPGIDFAVADAHELPYSGGYFDVVVCNNLWEHVPDPVRLLSGIRAVTRDRGFLVISTPNRYRTENLVRVLLGRNVTLMSRHHVTEYSIGQVTEQLRHGSYQVVDVSSRPIKGRGWKARLVTALFSTALSLVGSHHRLESTIFYLARRSPDASGSDAGGDPKAKG